MCDNPSKCCLVNLDTQHRIDLPHMTPIKLGRNLESDIKDLQVSREQIVCFANLKESNVVLKPIGRAVSGCNGLSLTKDLIYTIGHKDIVEVRLGSHKLEIRFDPEPNGQRSLPLSDEPAAKKPKMDFPLFNVKTPPSSTDTIEGMWEEIDDRELLIYTPIDCRGKAKIASFDIDGTIIKTKSGATFPKSTDDWTWNLPNVSKCLKQLLDDDYKVVFFTNQSGVGKDPAKIKDFKGKLENIVNALRVPVQIFLSLGQRMYRKPRTGMWDVLVTRKNDGIPVDCDSSFFVGDAAGREKNWAPKRNKDHSAADRLFALNIGLKFYTPEEYFLKQKPAPFKLPEFDPRLEANNSKHPDINYDKLNVVLMVGGPASGKTSFVKQTLLPLGYVHVNRDLLGTWQKCVKLMEQSLENKKNVVIDNTNGDKESRQRFIEVAKKFQADVRCFLMETSLAQMRHNNKFRELTDKSHALVSDIIIFSYRKNYQEPDLSEGFAQILKIPCIIKIEDKSCERLYKSFLTDKF